MKARRRSVILIGSAALVTLIFYQRLGYYYSSIDHDEHVVFFLKKGATFQRKFVNPYANEGDPLPVRELSPDVRDQLIAYCKFAYGITRGDVESLERCRAQIIRELQ